MTLLMSVRMHKTKAVIYSEMPDWIFKVNDQDVAELNKKDKSKCLLSKCETHERAK
jgi:hypothetical protein